MPVEYITVTLETSMIGTNFPLYDMDVLFYLFECALLPSQMSYFEHLGIVFLRYPEGITHSMCCGPGQQLMLAIQGIT